MAPPAAHLEPAGLISQLGFFLLLPLPFGTHFTRSERTFQVQTSLNTSQLLQFTPISSPTPSSCMEKEPSLCSGRHPDLELQGQHIHPAPETRTRLNTLICTGDPAPNEGTLQRKPHKDAAGITPASPGNAALTERCLERRMCFVTACSSVQLCPGVVFVPIHSFLALRKVCSLLCRIPSALQSTDQETRTAGKQRGAGTEERAVTDV